MANEYLLAPNFDLPPPPDGPLQLGQILDNPKEPRYPLNPDEVVSPLDSKVYNHSATGVTFVRSQLESKEFKVWARLADLVPFGGDAQFSKNKFSKDVFTIETIETIYFLPTTRYVEASIKASEDTRRYIEGGLWNNDVYMITGLKVVRGGSVTRVVSNESNASAQVAVDLSKTGTPVSAGATITSEASSSEADHISSLEPFVLAYQVRKIIYKKGKAVKIKSHNRGAMFDNDPVPRPALNDDITVVGLEEDCIPESDKSDDNWVFMASADGELAGNKDRVWIPSD